MELNDEGAALLASACKLLQGPAGTILSPEQCKFVNADFMVSFWLVSSCAASELALRHLRSDQRTRMSSSKCCKSRRLWQAGVAAKSRSDQQQLDCELCWAGVRTDMRTTCPHVGG